MIVDTSAVIAILCDEAEAVSCAHALENSAVRGLSVANFVEAGRGGGMALSWRC
jgi:uncharacterized protein with PIN domain